MAFNPGAAAWLSSVALFLACAPPAPRNVLLVSIDTLRADRLGSYGYARDTSPTLDRLAARGTLFENASAPSGWTVPSHASLLTGLYSRSHGMRFGGDRLARGVVTLAETLSRRGFATGAIVNVLLLAHGNGFERGFESFHHVPAASSPAGAADVVNRHALEWIAGRGEEPWFLFLHYYDVHSDYDPLPQYRELFEEPYAGGLDGSTAQLKQVRLGERSASPADARHLVDLYDAGVRQLDAALGRLMEGLEERGALARTLVGVTSDHGEEFMEHGDVLHGRTLYQELVHVPLILAGPGVARGERVTTPVSLVDVAPTLTALLGVPAHGEFEGVSLFPPRSVVAAADRPLFFETDHWLGRRGANFRRAVRRGDQKLHFDRLSRRFELYDLAADPGELEDLAAARPELVARLQADLEPYLQQPGPAGAGDAPSPELLEKLRELGYAR